MFTAISITIIRYPHLDAKTPWPSTACLNTNVFCRDEDPGSKDVAGLFFVLSGKSTPRENTQGSQKGI